MSSAIEIPDGLDAGEVKEFLASLVRKRDADQRMVAALEDDVLLARMMKQDYGIKCWTRARVYGNRPIPRWNEIFDQRFRGDDRRPVVMLGARESRVAKHAGHLSPTCGNNWAIDVVERYLRRLKVTAFDRHEMEKTLVSVGFRLRRKHRLSYHFWDSLPKINSSWGPQAYISGKPVEGMTEHQLAYLARLHGIVQQTKRLDAQIAA